MKLDFRFLLFLIIVSCSNERTLILPEIKSAHVTEVLDVSPAYIFYDESQPDSSLLNRKNLIGTTNWLVNVDKRLRLRQAMPHIKFLLEKRRNAKMHKNEKAKSFFTCNNLETSNLGFLEFTEVYVKEENPNYVSYSKSKPGNHVMLKAYSNGNIKLVNVTNDFRTEIPEQFTIANLHELGSYLKSSDTKNIVLSFNYDLTFQDYISIKHIFNITMNQNIEVSENEYLFP